MCELLGMSASVPTDICFSFSGLMRRGGATGPHKDGWGITFYHGRGIREFRDACPSHDSEIARLVRSYPIKSQIVISHIRKANRGRIALENTHPFVRELWGCYWSFAHNGQLKAIKTWPLEFYQPVGTTDSEHAFCWLLDELRRQFPSRPSAGRLQKFIYQRAQALAQLGVFNFLLSDSRSLYSFCGSKLCWLTRQAPFCPAELIDEDVKVNFAEHTAPSDVVSVIATQPLTLNEHWQSMVPGEMRVFRDGVCIGANRPIQEPSPSSRNLGIIRPV